MSPPQKPAPRPYSPYQNAASPTNQYGPPPAKRQRMSPDPRSPPNGLPNYAGPQHGLQQQHAPPQQHGLPQNGMPHLGNYGNPYAPSPVQTPYSPQPYTASPQSSFNTPQPYPYPHLPYQSQSQPPTPAPQSQAPAVQQASPPAQQSREMMPPPPRPLAKEDREEKLDLTDSLHGSGVNIKEEENYNYAFYENRHKQLHESFNSTQTTSFGSNTISPNNSFNMLTQATSTSSQDANGPLAGTIGQPLSEEDVEIEARKKREKAAIAREERRQHHLNNQFLLCNNVRKRMDGLANKQGVRLNVEGLLVRQQETAVMTNGAGTEGIVGAGVGAIKEETRPESMVHSGSPFEQVLSLISLAAGERLRGLLDEAFALSRARRYGDHGRVPPEFADIAEGEGVQRSEEAVPQSITGTQWDKTPGGEDDRERSSTPQRTTSYAGSLNATLRNIAARDKAAEAARIKKREARRRAAENNPDAANGAETAAPDASAEIPKMTKKEQIKAQKESKASDAALHQTTNQTAAMMTGGGKKKKYSWMTGGSAAVPTNRFAKPTPSGSASGTATPTKREPDAGAAASNAVAVATTKETKAPEWGDWREEGPGGKGVQIRDWVMVLERDGREKKALEKCYGQYSS